MIEFQTPQISAESVRDNRGTFTIEPLDRGFGYTFGNSLRRVLLSSLAGAAVTSVRIEGVAHEFSTIPGVKEDVTDIVLNLKEIVCRMHSDAAEIEAPLVVTGPGEVTAGDIDLPSGVEILNPETHIATLEKKTKLEIYLTIGSRPRLLAGGGQQDAGPADRRDPDRLDLLAGQAGGLPGRVGASRSAHRLRQAHAGHRDRRLASIPTRRCARRPRSSSSTWRSSASPSASRRCARPARASSERRPWPAGDLGVVGGGGSIAGADGMDDILIEELELGVRSYNCLKRAGVQTVGDLVQKSESELNAIPNFGRKSIEEVIETLEARGLSLRRGVELPRDDRVMRHGKQKGKLSRDSAHRKALMMNLSREVIDHERIQTTEAKAKAVKPELERLITLGKRGDQHSRRLAMARLGQDKFIVYKLFEEIAPRYAERQGGYTRILKLGPRRSDSTEMVFLELV